MYGPTLFFFFFFFFLENLMICIYVYKNCLASMWFLLCQYIVCLIELKTVLCHIDDYAVVTVSYH